MSTLKGAIQNAQLSELSGLTPLMFPVMPLTRAMYNTYIQN